MKPTFKIRIIFQSHICGCWCGRGKNWGNVTGKVSGKEVNVFLLDEKWSETRGYFFIFGSSFVPMKEKTTADHSSKWNIIWVEGKKEAISFCKMEFSSNLISQKPVPCQFLEPDKSSTHVHFKKEKTIKDNLSRIFATYFIILNNL